MHYVSNFMVRDGSRPGPGPRPESLAIADFSLAPSRSFDFSVQLDKRAGGVEGEGFVRI